MKEIKNRFIKGLFTLIIIIIFNCCYSQPIYNIKYSLRTQFDKLELPEILELIENYKYSEIELLTLQMKKIDKGDRFTTNDRIYFGQEKYYKKIKERLSYLDKKFEEGDVYFTKTQSPKLKDKFKHYFSLNIYINKETLYNTIIEISNNTAYRLISTKTINGGVLRTFEFLTHDKLIGFFIQTLDGDEISKISFLHS